MNISKHNLTRGETAIVVKVLNYAVSPDKIPNVKFIVATEMAALELIKNDLNHDPKAANALRTDVVDVLSEAHPPKQNINNMKRRMIQSLSKRKDLLVLPADKGKAMVIMDTNVYMDKIKVMLSDEKLNSQILHVDTGKNWWPSSWA